jgi:hypothetical protein
MVIVENPALLGGMIEPDPITQVQRMSGGLLGAISDRSPVSTDQSHPYALEFPTQIVWLKRSLAQMFRVSSGHRKLIPKSSGGGLCKRNSPTSCHFIAHAAFWLRGLPRLSEFLLSPALWDSTHRAGWPLSLLWASQQVLHGSPGSVCV